MKIIFIVVLFLTACGSKPDPQSKTTNSPQDNPKTASCRLPLNFESQKTAAVSAFQIQQGCHLSEEEFMELVSSSP